MTPGHVVFGFDVLRVMASTINWAYELWFCCYIWWGC